MNNTATTDELRPLMVTVKFNTQLSLENAIRQFRQKVKDSRILQEYRERTEFKRPGQKKREKQMRGRLRHNKEVSQWH